MWTVRGPGIGVSRGKRTVYLQVLTGRVMARESRGTNVEILSASCLAGVVITMESVRRADVEVALTMCAIASWSFGSA